MTTHRRCTQCGVEAVCHLISPRGATIPGAECWEHATAALVEYQAKLGELWGAVALPLYA